MDKLFWRSFLAWLDTAGEADLIDKMTQLDALIEHVRNGDVKSDARRMRRLIDQERLHRFQLEAPAPAAKRRGSV